MRSEYVASKTVNNGYNGATATVHLVLCGKRLIEVHSDGYHHAALQMDIQDKAEALWLLENHPTARRYF